MGTTGTFTDPAGAADPLTIIKTSGVGTVTDNGDGTWSWSHTPADNGGGSVTVTVDDGDGGRTPVTFTWTAINVAPSVGTSPADATGDEGSELTSSGSFTDVPADPLTIIKTSGVGTVTDNGDGTWSWSHTPADDGGGSVTVTADDGDGGQTDVTFAWTANNVAPLVSASFGGRVECGFGSVLTLSITDPGSADTHTAVIDWGDGTAPQTVDPATNGQAVSHTYSNAGVAHTAQVTVTDDDNGSASTGSSNTATVAYKTSGILQPVNWTQGTKDPISIFKAGSTIPVKVAFLNCNNTNAGSGLAVKIAVNKLTGSTPILGIDESITNTNSPDSGQYMRWADPNYMYNLNTKSLPDMTATYRITITVQSTGQQVWADFGLKAK